MSRPRPEGGTLNDLPQGVVNSRIAAIRDERIETTKVIKKLERLVVDTQNQVIRARHIMDEIVLSWPKARILENVSEAHDVLNEGT